MRGTTHSSGLPDVILAWRIVVHCFCRLFPLATFDPALNSAEGKKEFSLPINAIFNTYF